MVPAGPEHGEHATETDCAAAGLEKRQIKKRAVTIRIKGFGVDVTTVVPPCGAIVDLQTHCVRTEQKLS
jgi:hypothetical protein